MPKVSRKKFLLSFLAFVILNDKKFDQKLEFDSALSENILNPRFLMVRIMFVIHYLIPMALSPARFGYVGASLLVGKILQCRQTEMMADENKTGKSH
jgi:hypothetical protein